MEFYLSDEKVKQDNIEAYNTYPQQFNKKFEDYFNRYGKAFAENLSGILPAGARILGLGSGPGNAEKYFQVKDLGLFVLITQQK